MSEAAQEGKYPAVDFLGMPGHLLRRCQQIAVAIFIEECRALDLTPLQYAVLAALVRFGPMDQASLGGAAALDRTTILVVLNRLEERGLTIRAPSPRDRRAKIVSITEAGRTLLEAAEPAVRATQARILAPLEQTERELFVALLEKAADGNNKSSRAPYRMP